MGGSLIITNRAPLGRPPLGRATPSYTTTPPLRLAVCSALLGAVSAGIAVLGPLVTGTIRYHVSSGATGQIRGGDVATLVLVAPCCLVGAALIARGHRLGRVLVQGPAAFALYMDFQLAVGGDPGRYPGNSERFLPLFLAGPALACYVLLRALQQGTTPASPRHDRTERYDAWFLLVVGAFLVFGLHLKGLIDASSAHPVNAEYLADPVLFWVVKAMDLGIVVPVITAVGVGLLRRREWARRLRFAVMGWAALLGSSVAGMAIVMQASGDPAGSVANTIAFSSFAAIALGLTAVGLRTAARRPQN